MMILRSWNCGWGTIVRRGESGKSRPKLLKLAVDMGSEQRTIVMQAIALHFKPGGDRRQTGGGSGQPGAPENAGH